MDVHGGYKLAIDKSGRYVQFFAWEPSHLDSDYVDTYNPSVILDLVALAASSQPFSFQQAGGHGDIGTGFEVQQTTYNGTCVTCFKRWDLASLSSDPSPFVNNGTQISSALGYSYGRQYTSLYATGGTTASIVLACPVGGCSSTPTVYSDEVINMPTDGSAIAGSGITRLVRVNEVLTTTGFVDFQLIQSPDGKLIAYTSNFGDTTGKSYVFIVRVPLP